MITTILFVLPLALVILHVWAYFSGREVVYATIQGLMVGALYNEEVDEFDGTEYYTIQILLGVLSINILWDSNDVIEL